MFLLSVIFFLIIKSYLQNTQLQDLVWCEGPHSGQYFVSSDVERRARETSESYLEYAATLFDDFFDQEVATYCSFGVPCVGVPFNGEMLAALPAQAAAAFLGKMANHITFEGPIKFPLFSHQHIAS